MSEWTKVVTHPLGLAGFVLFLVFGYLAKTKRRDERRWLSPVAFAIAAVALIGGLVLAYVEVSKPVPPSVQTSKPQAPTQQQTNQQIQQTSTGAGSPNVQGVQGDVTITVDQSKGKTEAQKPAEKKPKQESK
jgi:hypothetical protein